jgi:hypothetical protein
VVEELFEICITAVLGGFTLEPMHRRVRATAT